MREALEGYERGFKIGGRVVNNLRYADDVVLIATSKEDLDELVQRIHEASKRAGLMINVQKTKVMVLSKYKEDVTVKIDNQTIEQVSSFLYLGARYYSDG